TTLSGAVAEVAYSRVQPHVCARMVDGRIFCWGGRTEGFGIGHAPGTHGDILYDDSDQEHCAPTPVEVLAADNAQPAFPSPGVSDFDMGDDDGCAVAGEAIQCWGLNETGIGGLSRAGHFDPETIAFVGASSTPKHVAVGSEHACAIFADATLWC